MQLVAVRLPSAFSVKKTRLDWNRDRDRVVLLRSVQLALHWSWRCMPDGIYSRRRLLKSVEISHVCFWNQWNPWKHQHVQSQNLWGSSSLRLWLTCQMWTELGQRPMSGCSLSGSLSCCIKQQHWHPSECDYHSVQPITSTVRSPQSPVFSPISNQPLLVLVLSLFDSLWLYLFQVLSTLYLSLSLSLRWVPVGQQAAF